MQGAGRVAFAGIMLLVLGTLNVIYGIGALDNANVFVNDTRLVFSDLNTLGWILIIWGVLELIGGVSPAPSHASPHCVRPMRMGRSDRPMADSVYSGRARLPGAL